MRFTVFKIYLILLRNLELDPSTVRSCPPLQKISWALISGAPCRCKSSPPKQVLVMWVYRYAFLRPSLLPSGTCILTRKTSPCITSIHIMQYRTEWMYPACLILQLSTQHRCQKLSWEPPICSLMRQRPFAFDWCVLLGGVAPATTTASDSYGKPSATKTRKTDLQLKYRLSSRSFIKKSMISESISGSISWSISKSIFSSATW